MVEKDKRITIWFDELDGEDVQLVGKKNAKWGEMLKANLPVSPGFALTTHASELFISETGIKTELKKFIKALGRVSYEKSLKFSKFAMHLTENTVIPSIIINEVFANYRKLCDISNVDKVPLAIRASDALSLCGPMKPYVNIRGEEDLENCIKKTWASVFLIEAITERVNQGIGYLYNIGIGISKMVNPRVSGIVCTLNPLNGDDAQISVDVTYGLGEALVDGTVTPDTYLVDKTSMEVISCHTGSKESMRVYEEGGSHIKTVDVPVSLRNQSCLTKDELMEVCRMAKAIDRLYGGANNIEFAIDADFSFPRNVNILGVNPELVWSKKGLDREEEVMGAMAGPVITDARSKEDEPGPAI